MKNYISQLFEGMAYDSGAYCDFSGTDANALAGKDLLIAIWNSDGSKILAIGGQKSLTINRSADSIEITSKDSASGWKEKIAGMKEWSIDTDGIYINGDESHSELTKAFENGTPVCLKIYNRKEKKGMFGGLAIITDYPIDAPFDDSATYTLTFEGSGKLVDLSVNKPTTDTLPE